MTAPPTRMRVRLPVLSVIPVLVLLAPPFAGETQVSGAKAWRIGFLEAGASSANHHFLDAFKRGLGELGYVEGRRSD